MKVRVRRPLTLVVRRPMHLVHRIVVMGGACAIGVASGCASGAPAGPPRILTVDPSADYRLFPVPPARTADSPACAPVGPPDSAMAYQRAATNSRYLGALNLRLPPEYMLMPADRTPRSETVGGLLVARWYAPAWNTPDGNTSAVGRPRALSAWVVPESGLPAVGADPRTQQVAFAECANGGPVRRARVVVFTLATGAESTAFLAAAWPVGNGRYLQLVASAPHAVQLDPIRRALLDAVTERAAAHYP